MPAVRKGFLWDFLRRARINVVLPASESPITAIGMAFCEEIASDEYFRILLQPPSSFSYS